MQANVDDKNDENNEEREYHRREPELEERAHGFAPFNERGKETIDGDELWRRRGYNLLYLVHELDAIWPVCGEKGRVALELNEGQNDSRQRSLVLLGLSDHDVKNEQGKPNHEERQERKVKTKIRASLARVRTWKACSTVVFLARPTFWTIVAVVADSLRWGVVGRLRCAARERA